MKDGRKHVKELEVPKDYSCYEMTGKENRHYFLTMIGLLAGAAWIFYQNLFFTIAITLFSIPLKKYNLRMKAEKRIFVLSDQFRDLLYSLSASAAAGRQMREALIEAEENLSMVYKAETPMIRELFRMKQLMTQSGESEDQLLFDFARRSGLEDIENFVEVCSICRAAGGNLEQLVQRASETMIDKITIRREIRMVTSQKQLEVRLLTVMPFAVVFFLRLTSPGYLQVMDNTLNGRILMSAALAGIALSYWISMKLTRISV